MNQSLVSEFHSAVKIENDEYRINDFEEILKIALEENRASIKTKGEPILVDADILLDVLLERRSVWFEDLVKVLNLVFNYQINSYISEFGLHRIWTVTKKIKGLKDANFLIFKLARYFSICRIDAEMLRRARKQSLSRVSVGIQLECACKINAGLVISLGDMKEFRKYGYEKSFTPFAFLDKFKSHENYDCAVIRSSVSEQLLDTEESMLIGDWEVEDFNLVCSKEGSTVARLSLLNRKDCRRRVTSSASGFGSVSALLAAFDEAILKAIGHHDYKVISLKVNRLGPSADDQVAAFVELKLGIYKIRKFHVDRDVVKACFYAYVKAVQQVYFATSNTVEVNEETVSLDVVNLFTSPDDIKKQYDHGEREFNYANLREANFDRLKFQEISFRECDLSFSSMRHTNLREANLEKVIALKSDLTDSELEEANLYKANFTDSFLSRVNLSHSNLSQSNFNNCDIDDASLCYSNLSSAILQRAILSNSDLTGANLSHADLKGSDLSGATLVGANLTSANLQGVRLNGTILTNANLSGANLENVDLRTTVIDGCNLSNADLKSADLRGLDLRKTIFCAPRLVDTAMPHMKFEIYGEARIKKVSTLLQQIEASHYQICAVHSKAYGDWWSCETGKQFMDLNCDLAAKGIELKRVFILPNGASSRESKEILRIQSEAGIAVRIINQKNSKNIKSRFQESPNLLICNNKAVPSNSFATMMLIDQNNCERSGYISYIPSDIEANRAEFDFLWENSTPYQVLS